MRLVELKTQALRYVVLGDAARAFRCYRHIVAALPSDLDARMKIADLCVTARLHDLARRIYAAVAFYDLQAGRPLHAVVASQALRSLGEDIGPLHDSLAQLYGQGSPRVGHGGDRVGARLAPPDPDADVPPFDLAGDGDAAAEAQAAAELAASTSSLASFPELFPPVPLLSDLSPVAFARVLDTVRVLRLPHGAKVVKEGEPGESFYLVAAGHVRVFSTDSLGREQNLAKLGEGAIFGELALVAAQPRGATVEVVGEADLLEVGAAALRAAASELEQLAEALGRFTRDRLLKNLLASSPLFKPFSPQQRLDLARRFTGHDVAPGTDLIREGDPGRGLYVVLAGEMEVVKGEEPFETTLATLRGGDLFGEIALLRGTPATATVRAARPSTVLFLAREYFERLIAALPEMRAFFEQLTEDRLRASEAALNDESVLSDDDIVLI
ncbi:MAG TPA: cyclic nucleotide-binding domain-containing protein [Polyangia bacterium]|nr:cyclic nucleotide-binding domain-containing protein [Polyangia bacterium]